MIGSGIYTQPIMGSSIIILAEVFAKYCLVGVAKNKIPIHANLKQGCGDGC